MPEERDANVLMVERKKLIDTAQEIHNKAETEKRIMTVEERANWDRAWTDADGFEQRAQDIMKIIEENRKIAELEKSAGIIAGNANTDPNAPGGRVQREVIDHLVDEVIKDMMLRENAPTPEQMVEERIATTKWVSRGGADIEKRALQVDSAEAGGYIVMPEQFVRRLIKSADDMVFMRRLGTVLPPLTDSGSAGIPSLDADPADADWTSELGTGGEDSTMDFGKRRLTPHPLAKLIKVSNTLLRLGSMDVEALVRERLNYKFGVTEEKAYLTGSGAQQPLGIFTAAAEGIPTGRDVVTGATDDYTYDGLKNTEYSLKGVYRNRARWLFHRDGIKLISQLKDDQSRPLLQPSIRASDPDTLFGYPMLESEYVPSTFTTGLYVGMFADFSYYWIVDTLNFQIQRLVELYAASNQTGFIARKETDGQPMLEEAFARMITS